MVAKVSNRPALMAVPVADGNKEENFFQKLFDANELQELQDVFSSVGNMYTVCFGKDVGILTVFSGFKKERFIFENIIGKTYYFDILNKMSDKVSNEIIVDDTIYPFIKVAGVNICVDHQVVATWVVTAVLSDLARTDEDKQILKFFSKTTTSGEFYKALDLLSIISTKLLEGKRKEIDATEETRLSKISEKRMERELKKNAAMAGVVSMLDSDGSFVEILDAVLETVGKYLDISSANVVRINGKRGTLDMISEWTNHEIKGIKSYAKNLRKESFPFLNSVKTVISSDSKEAKDYKDLLDFYRIRAVVSYPLVVNGKVAMYINFVESRFDKTWDEHSLKFLDDVCKIIHSIMTKRITKNSLSSSYASLEAILENAGCGIYVRDVGNKKTLYANQMIKRDFANAISKGKLDMIFGIDGAEDYDGSVRELYDAETSKWFDVHYTKIAWVDGREVLLCTVYDVTERKLYQKKIEHQANNDFLTGLYNRMRCEADIAKAIKEVENTDEQGALMYLDLDDFKHINDGLGHQYGDALLKSISSELKEIDGIKESCYRMGGDEFIAIIPPKHFDEVDRIVGDVRKIFSKPWYLKGNDYYCTMSMGIVNYPGDSDNVHDIIKKADLALYEAKKRGKNCVERFDMKLEESSHKRLDLEKNMRKATSNEFKEFEIYYQPIIDVSKSYNPCVGAEALIRWNNKQLGFVPPSEFIPLAEYLGLINPIGNYVLEKACADCKSWSDKGYNYKVNVNLSVVQLLQDDIVETIKEVLVKTGLEPEKLTLEVTESLAINDMERMKLVLSGIKKLGVRIALDDFGTGYSSLNHIKEIPLDVIKVDQCFIRDIREDEYANAFVKMVTDLANAIGVKVCVEGVENRYQYELLRDMKVSMIQGYYFGKPMRTKEFASEYVR